VVKEQFPELQPDFWYDLAKDALDRQLSFVTLSTRNWEHSLQPAVPSLRSYCCLCAKPDAVKVPQAVALAVSCSFTEFWQLVSLRALTSRNWATGPDGEELEALAVSIPTATMTFRWKARARNVEDRKANEKGIQPEGTKPCKLPL